MEQTILTNTKTENLRAILTQLAEKADEIKIAVAFFSDTDFINLWCQKCNPIQLIVSLRPTTSYYALKKISSLDIKINYLGDEFHSKYFIFYKDKHPNACVIGSSNLTKAGIQTNIETNAVLTDPECLAALHNQFIQLWQKSNLLSTELLDKYKDVYDKFIKGQKHVNKDLKEFEKVLIKDQKIKKSKLYIEATQYIEFCKRIEEVKALVSNISVKEYPKIPVYLTIDHFWHWIKTVWVKQHKYTITESERYKEIPKLFSVFCAWDKSTENHTEVMWHRSNTIFRTLLSEKQLPKLTKLDAKEIYSNMHSGAMRSKRFHADEKFITENSLKKIRATFKYLLYSKEDEIVERIYNVCSDPKYKLKEFKSSSTQELIGWVNPYKFPLRNDKADFALRALGYKI